MTPTRPIFRAEDQPGGRHRVTAYAHGYDESLPIVEDLDGMVAIKLATDLNEVIAAVIGGGQ
jgi:hypothetical protein